MIQLVEATKTHWLDRGAEPEFTNRAIAAVKDGKTVGIFGLYTNQIAQVLFSDVDADVWKNNPRAVVRGYRTILKQARRVALPVQAQADRTIEKSEAFLKHLGFKRVADDIYQLDLRGTHG